MSSERRVEKPLHQNMSPPTAPTYTHNSHPGPRSPNSLPLPAPPSDNLPPGWITQLDPSSGRYFYVDTTVARSTWSHPYEDEQYLREHGRPSARRKDRHRAPSVTTSRRHPSPMNEPNASPKRLSQAVYHEPPRKKARVMGASSSRSNSSRDSPRNSPSGVRPSDLTRELETILRRDFDFGGKYCHAATTSSAANPGLNIKGIGILGLPLSVRDAKLVQNLISATLSKTGADTSDIAIGNVWELDAGSLECSNPAWSLYLEEIVLKDVWKKLTPGAARPRLELKSLLLWEATADVLEYECTEVPRRDEFATIHVILPSFYTGGNVQLSYAGCSENYDLSTTSSFSTSLVAWYHGVDCIIKPIEQGRRLALSYRLLASPEPTAGPRPCLPAMGDKLLGLRRFFVKWSEHQEYPNRTAEPLSIIAYPLLHEYRENDLRADTLKFEDRHKIIHLKVLCDELGFQLGLGVLDDHLIGLADVDDTSSQPRMERVTSRRLTIKDVFDFDGGLVPGLSQLELDEGDLVRTARALEPAPDLVVYDSKACVESPQIEFQFSRAVIILFEKRRESEVLLHTRRTSYALDCLSNLSRRPGPSAVERKIVDYVLASLHRQHPYNFTAQTTLADIAICWHDAKLWNDTARTTCERGSLIGALESIQWLSAWKQFGFAAVRESLELCCKRKGSRMTIEFFLAADPEMYESIESGPALDAVLRWSSQQLQQALDKMQVLEQEEVALFSGLIRKRGVTFFWDVIMGSIIRMPNAYEFWTNFLRSLSTLRSNTTGAEDEKVYNLLVDEGLNTIISDFGIVVRSGDLSLRARRLSEIIDLCLSIRRLDMCRRVLFTTVPRDQGRDWVADITSPLYVHQLRRTLHEHAIQVYHKPFSDFFRAMVGCYLEHVLGAFSHAARRICGGCTACAAVDDFLMSHTLTQAHFVGLRTHLLHLETHLAGASDVVSFHTFADTAASGGHVLVLNKTRNGDAEADWRVHKNKAIKFLSSIGESASVERIMGKRYPEVLQALDGKTRFVHLEEGSRSTAQAGHIAIHHSVGGRWTVTRVTDSLPPSGH
ncbi:unnamed protein product [Mycena citricolor]|uniref:WW domain-containing protein n=1 Tax=Mycena citricolor TaxID=2018698 RepID=A0AAD2HSH3_9AGAR|nr:unnamed protein product [Mycena citricolor]